MERAIRACRGGEAQRLVTEAVREGIRRIEDGREYTIYQMVHLEGVREVSREELGEAVTSADVEPNVKFKLGTVRPMKMKRFRCRKCGYQGLLPANFKKCPECGTVMEGYKDLAKTVYSGSKKALLQANKIIRARMKKAAGWTYGKARG